MPIRRHCIEQMRALKWVKGPTTVDVQGNSKLTIPEAYVYLDPANTRKFLELQHNLSDGREVMVGPQNMEWTAYLEFSDEGYVKDNDKIDAPALLKTLQSNTEAGNEERRRRGWTAVAPGRLGDPAGLQHHHQAPGMGHGTRIERRPGGQLLHQDPGAQRRHHGDHGDRSARICGPLKAAWTTS